MRIASIINGKLVINTEPQVKQVRIDVDVSDDDSAAKLQELLDNIQDDDKSPPSVSS